MPTHPRSLDVDHVAVRQYGGGSTLLSFPGKTRHRTVLIDCDGRGAGPGSHAISEVVGAILDDVTEASGVAHIDVVIATHRPRAHVSGFGDERWREVEVGEVWMPWTEDPTNPAAWRLRDRQSHTAQHLLSQATAGSTAHRLAESTLTNAAAIQTLQRGFAGRPKRRFLPLEPRADATFETALLPGVTVHALEPSRDPKAVLRMDPPRGEAYLRAARTAMATQKAPPPFHPAWTHLPKRLPDHVKPLPQAWLKQLHTLGATDDLAIASLLERAVRATRLVVMFEIGNACLLFSGDGQLGSSTTITDDPGWAELIARTTFATSSNVVTDEKKVKRGANNRHMDVLVPI